MMKAHALVSGISLALAISWIAVPRASAAPGVPLTDFVLFGRVFDPGGQPVTSALPVGTKIAVFAEGLEGGDPTQATVLAETAQLLDGGSGTAQFYVLRIRRLEGVTTDHAAGDAFVLAADRLHVIVDWNGDGTYEPSEEVAETRDAGLLVTDAATEVRLLDLNGPLVDGDGDGLPDDWEEFFLQGTGQGWNDDENADGVNNGIAWLMGLDPNQNNTSNMPFLERNDNGDLVLYFRQSTDQTSFTYRLEGSDTLVTATWQGVSQATVEEVGVEGTSRILKATILEGATVRTRFYRINWH